MFKSTNNWGFSKHFLWSKELSILQLYLKMEWTARSNLVNVHKLAFKFKVQMFCKDEIKETLCAEFYTYVKKRIVLN